MKVLEKNKTKVLETENLLKEIIVSPEEFKADISLLKALKSQSAIAKYRNDERNIMPCALNTLKSISEALFERGFLYLDELRVNAKLALESTQRVTITSKGNKQTTTGLRRKVSELEQQLNAVQRSNFLLTVVVSELRSKLKQVAEYEGTVEERRELYLHHNRKIEAELNYTLNGEI